MKMVYNEIQIYNFVEIGLEVYTVVEVNCTLVFRGLFHTIEGKIRWKNYSDYQQKLNFFTTAKARTNVKVLGPLLDLI